MAENNNNFTKASTAVEMPPNQNDIPLSHVTLQSSPYLAAETSIPRVMYDVVIALSPVTLLSFIAFGMRAVVIMALSIFFMLAFEYIFARFRYTHEEALRQSMDGSALVSGILLGLNLGPVSPWWLMFVGAGIAMGLGKHIFGGLGRNPFNPVLVARVFLLISFPVQLTTWNTPGWLASDANPLKNINTDVITSATPLGMLKESGFKGFMEAFQQTDMWQYMLFNKGGCLGEISIFALLVGGLYLLLRKVISWQIPVSYIGTVFAITGIMYLVNPDKYANPMLHILSGALIIGAVFMATDMVTSPISSKGQIIFGIGCGLITAAIRLWGGFPEGVSFAILVMNGLVPLIDRSTKPRLFGAYQKSKKKEAAA